MYSITIDEMFTSTSYLNKRRNIFETWFYLFSLYSNILFTTQIIPLTLGIYSIVNPTVYVNITGSNKIKVKEKEDM